MKCKSQKRQETHKEICRGEVEVDGNTTETSSVSIFDIFEDICEEEIYECVEEETAVHVAALRRSRSRRP